MNIKSRVLEFAKSRKEVSSKDVSKRFDVTRQYASQLLRELSNSGDVIKFGKTHGAYYIHSTRLGDAAIKYTIRVKNQRLNEHDMLEAAYDNLFGLKDLKENIRSIFDYAFSEMVNNAIEHSKSKEIKIDLALSKSHLHFVVRDYGIGAFRNVMRKMKLKSEIEATQEILKGKATTQPKAHSGEGIFFTSKVADKFQLDSYDYALLVDNEVEDTFITKREDSLKGTLVDFKIKTDSDRHLSDVFKEFVTDDAGIAFNKTEVLVKLYTMGTIYISRSQARRVLNRLDNFSKVILDFYKVPTIGQAFADEIFRVFKNKYPDIEVETKNTNDVVSFMIERAKNTAEKG